MVTPAARREAVAHLRSSLEVSERRACTIAAADRSVMRYRAKRPDDAALRARLRELADQRRRFGYRRLHVLLRGEGWTMNRKKTQRLYGEEGLAVRRRKSRRRIAVARTPIPRPDGPNSRWSTDFVHDQLANGRRFRVLTIIDDVSTECGPGQTSSAVGAFIQAAGLDWRYIAPGKPTPERLRREFPGRMLGECLNQHLLFSMSRAGAVVADWVDDFNTARPHSAIGYMTPAAYAATLKPQRASALRHLEGSAPMPVATVALTRNSQPRIPVTPG